MLKENGSAPRFPGAAAAVDGSEAIASVETRISEIACAHPITPSSTMAAIFQAAVADGRPNLWGTPLRFIELESEHSSASSAEEAALAGARATNFTAGQGLILMTRARAPRPDLVLRMQGVALVGVFLRLTPFATHAGLDRDQLMAAVRPQLQRFFGKRGGRVVEANLDLVAAAWDGVVGVTAAVTALIESPRHDLAVPEVA
jgi:hypothetical protein